MPSTEEEEISEGEDSERETPYEESPSAFKSLFEDDLNVPPTEKICF